MANNKHYTNGQHNTFELIERYTANQKGQPAFYIGNVVKYLCRYNRKGTAMQDLEKALDYMQHLDQMRASHQWSGGSFQPIELDINDFITCRTLTETNLLVTTLQYLYLYVHNPMLSDSLVIEKNIKKLQKMVDK